MSPSHLQSSLFVDPVTPRGRRLRVPRWRLLTGLVLAGLAWLVVSSLLTLTGAVVRRDAGRDAMRTAAVRALPPGAESVATGFRGGTEAYAIADVAQSPARVLAGYGPGWGGSRWHEIAGSATSTTRSYLSAAQDRLLDVTATPCATGRGRCPAGGSTVTVEVSVGGPRS